MVLFYVGGAHCALIYVWAGPHCRMAFVLLERTVGQYLEILT